MKKTLFTALLLLLLSFVGTTFAQEIPNDGDLRILTETGSISTMAGWCDPYWSYAFYAWSDVFFLVYSEQLKADNYAIFKSSTARKYGNIFDNNLKIPFTSSVQPKNGTENTPSNKVIVAKAIGGKFTIPTNYTTPRNQIAGQLVTNTEYRLLRSTNPMRNYFFTNFLENKITIQASSNYSTNPNWKKACVSYYIGRCWDGIIDKATGDSSTDGQGGIVTTADWFKSWHATSIKPNEICDDGAQNGQPGKCKTDCSGIWNGTETGSLVVTKTLLTDRAYTPGENVEFRINISNPSTQTIQDIAIEDYFLPGGFEYVSSEIVGITWPSYFSTGKNTNGDIKILYTGFSLTAGQNGYIRILAKFLSCTDGTNHVIWSATSNGQWLNGYTNKKVSCSTTPVSITKTANPSTIQAGQTTKFTIIVNNTTATSLNQVRVEDVWPSCFSLVSWSVQTTPAAIQTQEGNLTQWTLASGLPAGQTFTISFSGQALANCAWSFTNTGRILYKDINNSDQKLETTTTVVISQPLGGISIDKNIYQQGFWPGDPVVYTITYKNNNTTAVGPFLIKDFWPTSLILRKATPLPRNINERPLVWEIPWLQPGEEKTIKIEGTISYTIQ